MEALLSGLVGLGALAVGQTAPDGLDLFASTRATSHVSLIIDASDRMTRPESFEYGPDPTRPLCHYFKGEIARDSRASLYPPPSGVTNPTPLHALSGFDQVRAVLLGCNAREEGLLPRWYQTPPGAQPIKLRIYSYQGTSSAPVVRRLATLDSSGNRRRLEEVEAEVRRMASPSSRAPMLHGIQQVLEDLNQRPASGGLDNSNCDYCDTHAFVLLSSGQDASALGNTPVTFSTAATSGSPTVSVGTVSAGTSVSLNAPFGTTVPVGTVSVGSVSLGAVSAARTRDIFSASDCYYPRVFKEFDAAGNQTYFQRDLRPAGCPTTPNGPHADRLGRFLFGRPEKAEYQHVPPAAAYPPIDSLTRVTGLQPIRVYTVGFRERDAQEKRVLQDLARAGGGTYTSASSRASIAAGLEEIRRRVTTRAAGSGGDILIHVPSPGHPEDNAHVYVSSFRASERGPWLGTIKKHCMYPDPDDPRETDTCYFTPIEQDGDTVYVRNPTPTDQWARPTDAAISGAGVTIINRLDNAFVQQDTALSTLSGNTVVGSSRSLIGNANRPPILPNDGGTALRLLRQSTQAGTFGGRRISTWSRTAYEPIVRERPALLRNRAPTGFIANNYREYWEQVSLLHGFRPETYSPGAGTYPETFPSYWPQGDSPNGGMALLKYSKECQAPGDKCYLAALSNAGLLHLFDAVTGAEIEALYPPEFIDGRFTVTSNLHQLADQPNAKTRRKYFFDGELSDYLIPSQDFLTNSSGNIIEPDKGDLAYLIAGLGRGGYGYYLWDIGRLPGQTDGDPGLEMGLVDGLSGGSRTPVRPPRPLLRDMHSSLVHLAETWQNPWMGQLELSTGLAGAKQFHEVAIFGSGHLDLAHMGPGAPIERATYGRTEATANALFTSCATESTHFGMPAELCEMPSLPDLCRVIGPELGLSPSQCNALGGSFQCTACNAAGSPTFTPGSPGSPARFDCPCGLLTGVACGSSLPGRPGSYLPCYDSSSYEDFPDAAFADELRARFSITDLFPFRLQTPVYRYENNGTTMRAFRLVLDLDLQPGDRFVVYDVDGNVLQEFTGQHTRIRTPFYYTAGFSFALLGNGQARGNVHRAYVIHDINVVPEEPTETATWYPSLYVVDLDRWKNRLAYEPYPDHPGTVGSVPSNGPSSVILARFTSDDCDNTDVARDLAGGGAPVPMRRSAEEASHCYDQNTPSVSVGGRTYDYSDLQFMTCPITAKPAVDYAELLKAQRIYVGDECGQIWAIQPIPGSSPLRLHARRLADLNSDLAPHGQKDATLYRKLFSLRLVNTGEVRTGGGCAGVEDLTPGVAFATGDVARPTASTGQRANVVGVIWDPEPEDGVPWSRNVRLEDLREVGSGVEGRHPGWVMALEAEEKALHKPQYLDAALYVQTFKPHDRTAEVCNPGSGTSYLYRLHRCTGDVPGRTGGLPQVARAAGTTLQQARRRALNDESVGGGPPQVVVDPKGRKTLYAGESNVTEFMAPPSGVKIDRWLLKD